jgi:hypothetical protein
VGGHVVFGNSLAVRWCIWRKGKNINLQKEGLRSYGSSGEPSGVGLRHLLDSDALFSQSNKDVSLSVLSQFSYNGIV